MDGLLGDTRFAWRALQRNPRYAISMAANLALGIGPLTVALFIARGILIRPLPYEAADRIVQVSGRPDSYQAFSVPDIQDLRDRNRVLERLAEFGQSSTVLCNGDHCSNVMAGRVSADFFDVFKIRPALGRTFLPTEDAPGAPPVLVVSDAFWRRELGGSPSILGQSLYLADQPYAVVGVLPPLPFPDTDVIAPFTFDKFRMANRENREDTVSLAFGRLRAGQPLDGAAADLSSVFQQSRLEHPEAYPADMEPGLALIPLQRLLIGDATRPVLLLVGTTAFLFILTGVNLSNLTLARFVARSREISVRCALGASRKRLAAQLIAESTLVASGGALPGLMLAFAIHRVFVRLASEFTRRAVEIRFDGSLIAIVAGLTMLVGIVIGALLVPSIDQGLRLSLADGGRSTAGPGRQRRRTILMGLQMALSLMLLIGASLLLRSLQKLVAVDLGYQANGVLTAAVQYEHSTPDRRGEACRRFQNDLIANIRLLPGVAVAGNAGTLPLTPMAFPPEPFQLEGRPSGGEEPKAAHTLTAGTGYFESLRIPLLAGRYFEEGDSPAVRTSTSAIVNRAFAERFFGRDDPVGSRISFDHGHSWPTIVGLVGNVRQSGLQAEPEAIVYRPISCMQFPWNILIRAARTPGGLGGELFGIVRRLDPTASVYDVTSLGSKRDEALRSPRLMLWVVGLLALVAFGISVAGVASLLSYVAAQRAREVAVRMMLGGSPRSIRRLLVLQCARPIVVGAFAGLLGALAASRLLSAALFGIEPRDPVAFCSATVLLLLTAAGVAAIAANRATRMDVSLTLRSE